MWQIRQAGSDDLPRIQSLVASVGGDEEDLQAEQFLVAEDDDGTILGCGRLKPYPDCVELASIAVTRTWRSKGVGLAIVYGLLELYQGSIYLICEDNVVEFFRRSGFKLAPNSEMPKGLSEKWSRYASQVGHLNLMRRDPVKPL